MKKLCALALWLTCSVSAHATHFLGGEIQVKHVTGLTYDLTTVLYLDIQNGQAAASAQGEIVLCLGDGKEILVKRSSSETLSGTPTVNRSIYRFQYTFAAPGTYTISSSFEKFANDIINLPVSSQEQAMVIQTLLNTTLPNTTAPAGAPKFTIGLRQQFSLPLATTDPDGDSLAFRLVKLLRSDFDCSPSSPDPTYLFPNEVTREGTFRIDRTASLLLWNAPTRVGAYTYAYVTEEWRKGTKVAESWRTNALFVTDQSGSAGPLPPYEPVQYFEQGLVTSIHESGSGRMSVLVYPVPSQDWIRVQVDTRTPSTLVIELLDVQGITVRQAHSSSPVSSHEFEMNVKSIPKGIYFLRAKSPKEIQTKKILRE